MLLKRYHTSTRYSEAVTHRGVVYLCGQVGDGDTIQAQTEHCLAQIDDLLKQVNSGRDKILQAIIWLSDIKDYEGMNTVWDAWIPPGFAPARACAEMRLACDKYKVEIVITAACD
ncbi:RidA family protein [Thiofilum flexile]|uniref:RidA family protein n=1 Tax=Thiofilum flexile TaxID=125627 RepID=UPI00037AD0E7|nr:RidA family protein [Thiofilum flexile]